MIYVRLTNFIIYWPNFEMAIMFNKIILGDGMIVTFIIIFHVLNTTSFQELHNFSSLQICYISYVLYF